MDRAPLDKWVHREGRVALLGDACHPMLPYRAQGAAMAIEDACYLGNLFSRLTHVSQITPLLHAYECKRQPRTSNTQLSSRLNQHIFHLPDGPLQQARDDSMTKAMLGIQDVCVDNANQWADPHKNKEQFSYDADEDAEMWWEQEGRALFFAVGGEWTVFS